jgi:predicted naringenin-chalcone synthase
MLCVCIYMFMAHTHIYIYAVSGLKAAKAICQESKFNRVLFVCVELCTLHMQLDDTVPNLVASALFGIFCYIFVCCSCSKSLMLTLYIFIYCLSILADASGAMILGAAPTELENPLFEVM